MKRSAFMTVEVLISLVIISMGVLTITSALKTFYSSTDKQQRYEEAAITLMSLKDTLSKIDFEKQKLSEGTLNRWKYKIEAKQIASQRTYLLDETLALSGYKGRYEILLYKVVLHMNYENVSKHYIFYQTRYKKLFDENINVL